MAIKLDKQTEQRLLIAIRQFALDELDLQLGEVRSRRMLDFIVQEAGPSIYNLAIAHAQAYMAEKVEDLAQARHEPEPAYGGR